VFTTLHTDDAAGSISRLIDIGVEHFLVSSTVVSALNQRLVRKICHNCKEEYVPTRVEMMDLGIDKEIADQILSEPQKYFLSMGRGCDQCRKTGYRERQGVYELITINPAIRELISKKQSSDAIARTARETAGVNMLFEEGLRLFLSGITTLGELQNLPRGDYKVKPINNILSDGEVQ
jgi:type IV pilus assembly protein PilB